MEIIDLNKPPKPNKRWQSGFFWVDFYTEKNGEFSKAIVSWPWNCQSACLPLPDDCKTQADALKYLREQLIEGLKEENGVNGP